MSGEEGGFAQVLAIRSQALQHIPWRLSGLGDDGAQIGVIDRQTGQPRALRQTVVDQIQALRLGGVAGLARQPGQIVDGVEIRPRIGGVGEIDLEPTEGGGGASDVVQLQQADAGHLPQSRPRRVRIGGVVGDQGVRVGQQAQSLADLVLVHQGQGPDAYGVGPGEPV